MNENKNSYDDLGLNNEAYAFQDPDVSVFKTKEGLDEEVVRQISGMKGEPEWMLNYRLKSLEHFQKRPMPNWGPDVSSLDLDHLVYYVRPSEKSEKKLGRRPGNDQKHLR